MAMNLKTLAQVNLTDATTAQVISATTITAQVVYITAPVANAGNIFIGDSDVSLTRYAVLLAPGESVSIEAQANGHSDDMDIAELYFDGTVDDDDIQVGYLVRSK